MSRATIQTATGPIATENVTRAAVHEHFFVDFMTPDDPAYMDVDWAEVRGACVNRASELRAQGIDLFVDWTGMGVGRNVLLLRDISRASGLPVVCPTGIYKALRPPALAEASVATLANLFVRELTLGIEGTGIRAGFIKIGTNDDGPSPGETAIHRAAAIAGRETGAAIGLHSPLASTAERVMTTLSEESFPLDRLIWAHAQRSLPKTHLRLAAQGVIVSFDNLSAPTAPDGSSNDDRTLDMIENLHNAGYGDQILISADATVRINPVASQYGSDATYIVRHFLPKLQARFGEVMVDTLMRENVVRAMSRKPA